MISDFSQWKHCCCSTYFSSFLPAASQKEFGWIPIIFYMKLSPLHFKKEISKIFHISNVNKRQFSCLPRHWELTLVPASPVGWSKAPATLQFRFFCVDIIFLGTFLYYVMHFLPCRCSPICLPDTNVSFVKLSSDFLSKLSLLSRSAGTLRAASREAWTTRASTGFQDKLMSSLGQSENLNARVGVEMILSKQPFSQLNRQ